MLFNHLIIFIQMNVLKVQGGFVSARGNYQKYRFLIISFLEAS